MNETPPLSSKQRTTVPPRGHLSALAVTGMVFSMVACCPPCSLFGALLGVVAMQRIGASNGALRGMKLARTAAVTGMVLGVAGLVIWWRFETSMEQWRIDTATRQVESLVRAAQDGDVPTASAVWVGGRTSAITDRAMLDFGAITRARYGSFRSFNVALLNGSPGVLSSSLEVAGTFSFEGGDRPGSATLVAVATANWSEPTLLLSRIAIDDSEKGDVALPASASKPVMSRSAPDATSQPAP